ncbi:MAG: aconitate hydratase AcnA [Methylocystaceae bacterium]|nr:aconitate hydratase AcnA [Methylocystaceae bacterium]
MTKSDNSFNTLDRLTHAGKTYSFFSLKKAQTAFKDVDRLPYSLKIVLENLLRFEDGQTVSEKDVAAVSDWLKDAKSDHEIAFRPARVLMQDFTGVPAVVDLAAMRDSMVKLKGDPKKINPLTPVDLVIDHSVMVDFFGGADSFEKNMDVEFSRNKERYEFLKWGQKAFDNFRVVPPGTGICHQVNLEHLAHVAFQLSEPTGETYLYPDTCVGTDSHTTMVNGLGVLGWGVGGIEAEAVMLGQPVSMTIPEVIGYKLNGNLPEGVTATDLVLTIVETLRKLGVVGKFVEFYGPGLKELSLPNRATIANMAPEYGATCGIFPIDEVTVRYLEFTNRDGALVEAYARENLMWYDSDTPDPVYTDSLELDLSTVEPSLAGPKRPQDRISLQTAKPAFAKLLKELERDKRTTEVEEVDYTLSDGDVVIAAITSCTNTSNPDVLIGAGLLAKRALEKGLKTKPWVKTSLAPGSQVVASYLDETGLQHELDALGFNIVGFGCTTCIGNSGPLADHIVKAIEDNDLTVSAVLSGNRNFEGRISQQVKANYLASPPLVVAYALAGTMDIDLANDPLGEDQEGNPVYLKDIWPSNQEIAEVVGKALSAQMYKDRYGDVFSGPEAWKSLPTSEGALYQWNKDSLYVRNPPFFEGLTPEGTAVEDVKNARILGIFGDSVTTDHISPAGAIKEDSPAGKYLKENGVKRLDFNSYGARRGNHEVMMRGTFANIRIRNKMVPGSEGGVSIHYPNNNQDSIYDVAMTYQAEGVPLVVFAGKEYGTGSSRDWAAKGTKLLGVKAVIAESFERIHRTNLVCMGVLPLQLMEGQTVEDLGLSGDEVISITGVAAQDKPRGVFKLEITDSSNATRSMDVQSRIDTVDEYSYFKNGGILNYVLRSFT